ncbi:hypothetical protein TNCV_233181 [Trichonephila clavipes]|nr:hypothetical protein TNCV_233181 [Trichonephila clavipes]
MAFQSPHFHTIPNEDFELRQKSRASASQHVRLQSFQDTTSAKKDRGGSQRRLKAKVNWAQGLSHNGGLV